MTIVGLYLVTWVASSQLYRTIQAAKNGPTRGPDSQMVSDYLGKTKCSIILQGFVKPRSPVIVRDLGFVILL